jgi:hypothetical protein
MPRGFLAISTAGLTRRGLTSGPGTAEALGVGSCPARHRDGARDPDASVPLWTGGQGADGFHFSPRIPCLRVRRPKRTSLGRT